MKYTIELFNGEDVISVELTFRDGNPVVLIFAPVGSFRCTRVHFTELWLEFLEIMKVAIGESATKELDEFVARNTEDVL